MSGLLCFLSPGLCSSAPPPPPLSLAYSSHKLLSTLPPLSSFKVVSARERQRERESSCYAVCLPPHLDLLLCFGVPERAETSNIGCHHLSPEIISLTPS